jgi:hypothetical protein
MAWLESHQELARHPKMRRFARVAGISIPTAIGHMHLLWWWAMDYAQNGDITRYTSDDIADAVFWEGEPDALFKALVDSGFLDSLDGSTVIHDWQEYAGKRLEQMAKDRDRKRAMKEMHQQNPRPDQPKQKAPNKKTQNKFEPPTVEEVRAYCESRKNGIDAEQFVAFYGSKGWRVGNQSMKDWKQAVITWEKRRKESSGNGGNRSDSTGFDPCGMSGFSNALDRFDDDGNEISSSQAVE